MKSTLAIDPSVRSCGWALFYGKTLAASGTARSNMVFPESANHIAQQVQNITRGVDVLVIEYPTMERSMRGRVAMQQGYTHNLAFVAGLIAGAVVWKRILIPFPIQWKGNVPKEVTQMRLTKQGFIFATSDEADAIALGLWSFTARAERR